MVAEVDVEGVVDTMITAVVEEVVDGGEELEADVAVTMMDVVVEEDGEAVGEEGTEVDVMITVVEGEDMVVTAAVADMVIVVADMAAAREGTAVEDVVATTMDVVPVGEDMLVVEDMVAGVVAVSAFN